MKNLIDEAPFVATEEDLLSIGASLPTETQTKTEEKTKYKSYGGAIKNGIALEPAVYDEKETAVVPTGTKEEQREGDFQYTRANLYNIIETSSKALAHLAQIASQSQHPRAFEVLAALTKTIADANKELIKIHAEKQRLDNEDPSFKEPTTVTNNLFVGTTAELDAMIKRIKSDQKNG